MKGIGCLIKDTQLINDMRNVMQVFVGERLEANKPAKFPDLYNALRSEGLEVDAVSAGVIYNELFSKYDDPSLSTASEVEDYTEANVRSQMQELVDEIAGETSAEERREIGKLPPERQVASMLGRMFKDFISESHSEATKSAMKKMEGFVATAARSFIDVGSNKKSSPDILSTLNDFFDTEATQFKTLNGGVNTLRTLFNRTKVEVNDYLDEVTRDMNDVDADLLRQKWNNYMSGFIQSAYDIMLSKTDQNRLVKKALEQVQVDGVDVVNKVSGAINWDALIKHNDPDTVSNAVAKLFRDGIVDADGNTVNFSADQARRIGEYFKGLYQRKLATVQSRKAAAKAVKKESSVSILSDFIKDKGFFRIVKGKDGETLMSHADWDKALKQMQANSVGAKGLAKPIAELDVFLRDQKDAKGNPKYTDGQIAFIKNQFEAIVAQKLLPGTNGPSAMRKFGELAKINSGKAFNESTQSALNQIVGVGAVEQQVIDQLNQLAQAINQVMAVGTLNPASPSASLMASRGAYAFQALAQLERRIKEIVRASKIDKATSQRLVKYTADLLTSATTSLLINPNNGLENIFTGFATNISESLNMALTTPELYKKLGPAQKDFWTAFASHVSGGVANEVVNEEEITSDLHAGERLRFKTLIDEFKKGPKSALGAILKSPQYAVSIIARTFMNSFDAGFNAALLRKRAISTVYHELFNMYGGKEQGPVAREKAMAVMNKAFNVSDATMQEIEDQNNQIMSIMKAAGLSPTWADRQQNKRDMMLSLYADAMAGVMPGASTQRVSEVTRALVESASEQARILGGKKKIPTAGALDFITNFFYGFAKGGMFMQQAAYERMQKKEMAGKLNHAAGLQLAGTLSQNFIGKFLGGIANFGALAVTATPAGFLNVISLRHQREDYIDDNPSAKDISTATPADIRKTSELYGLQRSIAIRAAMGTLAMTAYVMSQMFDDDDDAKDDGFIENLQKTATGRRMIQKYLPIGLALATNFLNESYDRKGKKLTKWEATFQYMANLGTPAENTYAMQAITRAKTDEKAKDAVFQLLVSQLPGFNANQVEQMTRWYHAVQSMADPDQKSAVLRDEKISSDIFKKTEDLTDAYLRNGALDLMRRAKSDHEKVNRYARHY